MFGANLEVVQLLFIAWHRAFTDMCFTAGSSSDPVAVPATMIVCTQSNKLKILRSFSFAYSLFHQRPGKSTLTYLTTLQHRRAPCVRASGPTWPHGYALRSAPLLLICSVGRFTLVVRWSEGRHMSQRYLTRVRHRSSAAGDLRLCAGVVGAGVGRAPS